MGALDLLESITNDPLTDSDINWVQFVSDHVGYIRSTLATRIYPTGQIMAQNRYDMKRYIRNVLGGDQEMWWIILRINDMSSDMDFTYDNVANGLYVVTTQQMSALYGKFISTSANRVTDPIGQ